jgi:hypothetical protein
MRTMSRVVPLALCLVLAVSFAACKKPEAPAPMPEPTMVPAPPTAVPPAITITSVDLGKALGPDKKVKAAMDTFAPKDTIFTVVSTDGTAASATINVKWTFQDGQTVKEDSRTISPTGPATTEFSIQKAGGWPKGEYKAEVTVDNGPATTKTFTVK